MQKISEKYYNIVFYEVRYNQSLLEKPYFTEKKYLYFKNKQKLCGYSVNLYIKVSENQNITLLPRTAVTYSPIFPKPFAHLFTRQTNEK